MKHYIASLLVIAASYNTLPAQTADTAHWNRITAPTSSHLLDVHFPNPDTGYICGEDSTLLKSTDGGMNWSVIHPAGFDFTPERKDIVDIHFISATTGYAVISNRGNPAFNGRAYRTTDGGSNWSLIEPEATIVPYRCFYFNENYGFHLGAAFFSGKTIARFKNGIWSDFPYPSTPDLFFRSYSFPDQKNGILGADDGTVYTTTDSGGTWTEHTTLVDTAVTDLLYLDENTIMATTKKGTLPVIMSYDNGNTWEYLPEFPMTFFYPAMNALAACKADSLVVVGGSYRLSDFGAIVEDSLGFISWIEDGAWQQIILESGKLNAVSRQSDSFTFIVGNYGQIYTQKHTPTGVPDIDLYNRIDIYPNPTTGILTIGLRDHFKIQRIYLSDISGRKIRSFPDSGILDISGLSSGIYFLTIITEHGAVHSKIVKQ